MTRLRRTHARFVHLSPHQVKQPPAPRHVLFVLLSECGSMVLADPAIRSLTENAEAKAYLLTFAHNRPALAITGTLPEDRIFSLRAESVFTLVLDYWRWRRWMRERHIDSIVDLELFARLTAVLCFGSGVRRRVGFHDKAAGAACYRGDLYTHKVVYDPARHISRNFLALTDALLARQSVADEFLPQPAKRILRQAEIDTVKALLASVLPRRGQQPGRLVLINPNASEFLAQRRWPAAHFLALIRNLLKRHADLHVLLIGGPSDVVTTSAMAASIADPRCVDIAARLTLAQLPALFAVATVLVSNDSGPAHFASVSDMPVVVLFGPETPTLYRPLGRATVISAALACSPCVNVGNQRQTRCRDNQCMQRITVNTVWQEVEKILAEAASRCSVTPLPLPTSANGEQLRHCA